MKALGSSKPATYDIRSEADCGTFLAESFVPDKGSADGGVCLLHHYYITNFLVTWNAANNNHYENHTAVACTRGREAAKRLDVEGRSDGTGVYSRMTEAREWRRATAGN